MAENERQLFSPITAIHGPYRNLPEPQNLAPGNDFYKDVVDKNGVTIQQRQLILEANRNAHGGEIHSDFAGLVYPCDKHDPSRMCTEPALLKEGDPYDPEAPEVHHVIRKKDKRCCAWGTNSNSNAVVISRKLNRYFWYNYPSGDEVTWVNNVPPYTP